MLFVVKWRKSGQHFV
jgi:hypothetical protein